VTLSRSLIPGVDLSGTLNVKIPDYKFIYVKRENSLLPERINIEIEMNTEETEINLTHSEDNKIETKEIPLFEFPLPPITIVIPIPTPVGILPFPLKFGHDVILKTAPFSISGKMKYSFPYVIYTKLGAKYENGSWTDISSFKAGEINTSNACKSNFSASVELSYTMLTAEYELKPFNLELLKATMGISEKVNFEVQTVSPEWSLKAFATIEGGVKTDFYTGEKKVLKIGGEGKYFEKKLEGNFSDCSMLTKISGDLQNGVVNKPLPSPIIIKVISEEEKPVKDIIIEWTSSSGSVTDASTKTNEKGEAQANWTLGQVVGQQTLTVKATNTSGDQIGNSPLTFTATAHAENAQSLTLQKVSGDNQSGAPQEPLLNPLVIKVVDVNNQPVNGITIKWAPDKFSGSVSASSNITDIDGSASVNWTLGMMLGIQTITVTATDKNGKEIEGSPITFEATSELYNPFGEVIFESTGTDNLLDVFFDKEGNIYMLDQQGSRLRKISSGSKSISTIFSGNIFFSRVYVYNKTIYLQDDKRWIWKFISKDEFLNKEVILRSESPLFIKYDGFYIDESKNLYSVQYFNASLVQIHPDNSHELVIFSAASLPCYIVADTKGDIYINSGHSIIKADPANAYNPINVAGTGIVGSDSVHLNKPQGFCFDSKDNLYVADAGNLRIQMWAKGASHGVTILGGLEKTSGLDHFSHVTNVFVNANGDLYASDLGNNRIVRFKLKK
jgi:hypothetical protein